MEAPALATIMTNPEPPNMLSAKFSLPYAVATAVVHNNPDIRAFYSERLSDLETLELAHRVEIVADPQMDLRRYDYPAARVAISLKDGRVLTEEVTAHLGASQKPACRSSQPRFPILAIFWPTLEVSTNKSGHFWTKLS